MKNVRITRTLTIHGAGTWQGDKVKDGLNLFFDLPYLPGTSTHERTLMISRDSCRKLGLVGKREGFDGKKVKIRITSRSADQSGLQGDLRKYGLGELVSLMTMRSLKKGGDVIRQKKTKLKKLIVDTHSWNDDGSGRFCLEIPVTGRLFGKLAHVLTNKNTLFEIELFPAA